jgi:hypothetical protein
MKFWFTLPHIPENLYVACDLFFGSLDALFAEVVDEKLVAPSAAAAGL